MAKNENIKGHGFNERTADEQRKIAVSGGIASGRARRAKKSMREMAKALMETDLPRDSDARKALKKFGVADGDLNYQAAIITSLMKRAIQDGDTSATRLLGELTGELGQWAMRDDALDIIDMQYPAICLPDNGRDKCRDNALRPQSGPQTMFMASEADIVIYGGAAGGGKTYALLLEGLRHRNVKGFGAVIFRKNYTQISAEGGLWDASHKIYDQVPDAHPHKTPKYHWEFDGGGKIHFAHIGSEDDLESWQGTEIAYLGFDELTHFSKHQFLYMLSRNRTTCGVRPYVRATCNPDADSWVAEFVSWWIDQDTGYAIQERSGRIRYMTVLNDVIHWSDSRQSLADEFHVDLQDCKSVTFIASSLADNKVLTENDPGYLANLKALAEIDMERLLKGNWKIKAAAGLFFKANQVGDILQVVPNDVVQWVRCWDLAATSEDQKGDAAYTAGVLMGKRKNGRYIVADVINRQLSASEVRRLIKHTAQADVARFKRVRIRLPQDPGQAGKEQAQSYIKFLSGFNVTAIGESGSKESRAEPMAAQWQAGNFDIVYGPWNDEYLSQLENFPEGKWKDMVDASANAFAEIEARTAFNIDNLL